MINTKPSEPRYSLKTVESATPLTHGELEEKRLEGWQLVRTVDRTSRQGRRYLQYEFERYERPRPGDRENRVMQGGENR